jgi:hypothetical protein
MELINLICNKSEKCGMILMFTLLNIMLIGFKIYISAIGKVLILASMIGVQNNNNKL